MTATEAITKLREVIRRQHKALATEASYVHCLRRYITALADMPRTLTSEQHVEWSLVALAQRHDVAASTQNQAFNAIAFFYKDVLGTPLQNVDALRATRPAHLRHAPTMAETRALLQACVLSLSRRDFPHVPAGVALDVARGDVQDEVTRWDGAAGRIGGDRRRLDLDPRPGRPGPGAAPLSAQRIAPELGWRGARQTKSSPQVREEPGVPPHRPSCASPL